MRVIIWLSGCIFGWQNFYLCRNFNIIVPSLAMTDFSVCFCAGLRAQNKIVSVRVIYIIVPSVTY